MIEIQVNNDRVRRNVRPATMFTTGDVIVGYNSDGVYICPTTYLVSGSRLVALGNGESFDVNDHRFKGLLFILVPEPILTLKGLP
jgi:hypothetical protein